VTRLLAKELAEGVELCDVLFSERATLRALLAVLRRRGSESRNDGAVRLASGAVEEHILCFGNATTEPSERFAGLACLKARSLSNPLGLAADSDGEAHVPGVLAEMKARWRFARFFSSSYSRALVSVGSPISKPSASASRRALIGFIDPELRS